MNTDQAQPPKGKIMTQAQTAERAHELVTAEVERSTKLYSDAHGRKLPAEDIAAGVVLKLVIAGLLRDDFPADVLDSPVIEETVSASEVTVWGVRNEDSVNIQEQPHGTTEVKARMRARDLISSTGKAVSLYTKDEAGVWVQFAIIEARVEGARS